MLFIPIIAITALCGLGSFLLPSKYESSTTILVQHDESINPLISYEEAMSMASEDRLRTINEIIYSRSTIQKLIDSLGIGSTAKTESQRQLLVERISFLTILRSRKEDRTPSVLSISIRNLSARNGQHHC